MCGSGFSFWALWDKEKCRSGDGCGSKGGMEVAVKVS